MGYSCYFHRDTARCLAVGHLQPFAILLRLSMYSHVNQHIQKSFEWWPNLAKNKSNNWLILLLYSIEILSCTITFRFLLQQSLMDMGYTSCTQFLTSDFIDMEIEHLVQGTSCGLWQGGAPIVVDLKAWFIAKRNFLVKLFGCCIEYFGEDFDDLSRYISWDVARHSNPSNHWYCLIVNTWNWWMQYDSTVTLCQYCTIYTLVHPSMVILIKRSAALLRFDGTIVLILECWKGIYLQWLWS